MVRPLWRFVLALGCLGGSWLIACEALRERAPWALAAFVLFGWSTAFAAWRAVLPPRRRVAAGLVLALIALDVAVDLWLPYERRFALVGWQLLRLGAVVLALGAARLVAAGRVPARLVRGLAVSARVGSAVLVVVVSAAAALIATTGARDATAPADATLVLGFSLDEDHRPAQQLRDRVAHAVALYRRGLAPHLVLSGGGPPGPGPTEADVMRELARAAGVPDAAITIEPRARSTVENIRFAVPLLRAIGARRVLLVTEPFHMPRAMLLARRAGLDARPSPAPSHAWRDPRAVGYWVFRDAIVYVAERARDPFVAHGGAAP